MLQESAPCSQVGRAVEVGQRQHRTGAPGGDLEGRGGPYGQSATVGSPCMLGNLLGQTGLEKPRLHSQGVHACWLAHQSGQRDLRVAELPNPKGQTLWLHPLHTTTWSRIWGRQVLEEVCQGRSSGPRRKHSHLDSCSHSASALSPSQILTTAWPPPQPSTRSGMNTAEKGT